jgi:hypothetical protein
MRIILLVFFLIIGANIGINLINEVSKIQDSKMSQFCKVDPSYCAD